MITRSGSPFASRARAAPALRTIFYKGELSGPALTLVYTLRNHFTKLGIAFALLGLVMGAYADNSTLQKISKTGVISLGHRESSMPFSYYGKNRKIIGYSHDYAMKIVAAIEKKLHKPLKVKMMPVLSQNRIPLLQNGTIDLECGSTTHNFERQRQAAFSNTIFIVSTRLLTRKSSGIHDFSDLKGKTVVTTAGTTSERLLRKMRENVHIAHIISVKDHDQAFLMLKMRRAAAFMMDDALLASERAKLRKKERRQFVIVGTPQSYEAYGCMLRKGDPQFKQLVDDTIAKLQTSGQANAIYRKWFQSPIPPRGINLNFAQSEKLKALFRNPNDKILDEFED